MKNQNYPNIFLLNTPNKLLSLLKIGAHFGINTNHTFNRPQTVKIIISDGVKSSMV